MLAESFTRVWWLRMREPMIQAGGGDAKNKAGSCPVEMRPWEHTRGREEALPRCVRRNMPEGENLPRLPPSLSS